MFAYCYVPVGTMSVSAAMDNCISRPGTIITHVSYFRDICRAQLVASHGSCTQCCRKRADSTDFDVELRRYYEALHSAMPGAAAAAH